MASLAAGDFNGDGHVDLASANYYANNVTVLLGHGDGSLHCKPARPMQQATIPTLIVQGDFNGDGRLDVAVANYDFGTVTVLLGQGNGTFQKPDGNLGRGQSPRRARGRRFQWRRAARSGNGQLSVHEPDYPTRSRRRQLSAGSFSRCSRTALGDRRSRFRPGWQQPRPRSIPQSSMLQMVSAARLSCCRATAKKAPPSEIPKNLPSALRP